MEYIFLTTLLVVIVAYVIYLRRPVDMSRYGQYAVVTGATGGIGKAIIKRLSPSVTVIAVGRSGMLLDELKAEDSALLTFCFDFQQSDLSQFEIEFDNFLKLNMIDKAKIGSVFSNAGSGEYKRFTKTTLADKELFMKLNVQSHICVADYAARLFKDRTQKSALTFTSSMCAVTPIANCALYHAAKAAVSALAAALHNELDADVLAVCPTMVRNTKFFDSEGMKSSGKMLKFTGFIRNILLHTVSVSPDQVAKQMTSRIGKVTSTSVGWPAVTAALFRCIGVNLGNVAWGLMRIPDAMFE